MLNGAAAQLIFSGRRIEVKMMDAINRTDNALKSLPSLRSVRGLRYDETCVHFSFSIKINQKRCPSAIWSWYVVAGEKEPGGDWKFWGLTCKPQIDFGEFGLRELQMIAKSWNSELLFDADFELTPLSRVMEKLGVKWHNSDW